MPYSQLIQTYLGVGLLTDRPIDPLVAPGAAAFYFGTDTSVLYVWDGAAWRTCTAAWSRLIMKAEGFDAVSAPAIPVGWTADSELVTATSNSPSSPPNSLIYPTASVDGSTVPSATFTTPDTNGGNVKVSATVRFADATGASGEQDIGIFARSPAHLTSATFGGRSLYELAVVRNVSGQGLVLRKAVSGSQTLLGNVGATAFSDATDYQLTLICNGSAIEAICQRLSDGYRLNSSGVFVSDPSGSTIAISVTDTSITGAGYAGLWCYRTSGTGGDVGVDDWLLEATA